MVTGRNKENEGGGGEAACLSRGIAVDAAAAAVVEEFAEAAAEEAEGTIEREKEADWGEEAIADDGGVEATEIPLLLVQPEGTTEGGGMKFEEDGLAETGQDL